MAKGTWCLLHTDSFTLSVSKYTMQVFMLETSGKQEKSLLSGDSCSMGETRCVQTDVYYVILAGVNHNVG